MARDPGAGGRSDRLIAPALLCLAAALALPHPARAVTTTAAVELAPSTRQALERLQEQWLQWVTSFYQDKPEAAATAVRELKNGAAQLGFTRLPDFARGMAARALEASAAGSFQRAAKALDAAEALDPGDPGLAAARSRLAWRQGSYLSAFGWYAEAFLRLRDSPLDRVLLGVGLANWALAVLLIAAVLFLLLEIAVHGSAVYGDLHRLLARRLSRPVAHAGCAVLLLWPLLLPAGPLWLLLFWSALLWSYGSSSERAVTIALWLLACFGPVYSATRQRQVVLDLSPPVRALDGLREGRLYGALFSDLGVLQGSLPGNIAVQQLLADLHRELGQWESARTLYRQVLEAEPDNVAALLDLGAFYLRRSDFASANQYFQRAASVAKPIAAAYFDLSLSYSEAYLFEESRQALAKARRLDNSAVSRWLERHESERVVSPPGGLARYEEIRAELARLWLGGAPPVALFGLGLGTLASAVFALVAAMALIWARFHHRAGGSEAVGWLSSSSGRASRLMDRLLPAWRLVEDGRGILAFATLLLAVALLIGPLLGRLWFRLAWSVVPPGPPVWLLPPVALGLWAFFRLRGQRPVRSG